jgi:DNA-directed RNA polymerase subunit M/transcription elongation factor TFIIS
MNPTEEWTERPDVDPSEQPVHYCERCGVGMISVGSDINDLYVCLECGEEMEKTTLEEWNETPDLEPFDIVKTPQGEGIVTDIDDEEVMVSLKEDEVERFDIGEVWT